MDGVSTRFAFKVLSQTFNYDSTEIAADPVHLMYMLEQSIRREQFPERLRSAIWSSSRGAGTSLCRVHRQRDPEAYLESYHDYGQNLFDRYVDYADAWIEDQDFKDPDTANC
jgi:serine protein kinase